MASLQELVAQKIRQANSALDLFFKVLKAGLAEVVPETAESEVLALLVYESEFVVHVGP